MVQVNENGRHFEARSGWARRKLDNAAAQSDGGNRGGGVWRFDPQQVLRLVNRAGERLLAQPAERLLVRDATTLGLAEYLVGVRRRAHIAAHVSRGRRAMGNQTLAVFGKVRRAAPAHRGHGFDAAFA